MSIEYVTVTDVEIVSVGMAWKGVGGPYYITAEHLADMVAAQEDPLIRAARVKLGHVDPRFNGALTSHDPGNLDAEPAFGTWTNLRLAESGTLIIADAIEMPSDLAASLPSSFPNRSIEWVWDYETEGGRRYSAVLTDVALLGTRMQAVSDLADIVRANLPAAVAEPILADLTAAAAAREETILPTVPGQPAASVSVDRICQVFNFEWATSEPVEGLDTYWWWVRDVRVDPDEVIATDGEGGVFRVPYSTDGEHDVTFGEPVEVRETYVDVTGAAAAASAAQARHGQRVLANQLARPEKPARDNPAATRPRPEEGAMSPGIDIAALRSRTGLSETELPDDATEDQINTALQATPAEPVAEPETEPEATPETAPVTEPEATPESEPAAASRTVAVDRTQFEQMQRDAAAGAAARREQLSAALDRDADDAVLDGRITPASRGEWRAAIDPGENPDAPALARAEAEKKALKGLTAGRVPVDGPRGGQPSDSGEDALLAATRSHLNIPTKEG
jgi:hypothetical protein